MPTPHSLTAKPRRPSRGEPGRFLGPPPLLRRLPEPLPPRPAPRGRHKAAGSRAHLDPGGRQGRPRAAQRRCRAERRGEERSGAELAAAAPARRGPGWAVPCPQPGPQRGGDGVAAAASQALGEPAAGGQRGARLPVSAGQPGGACWGRGMGSGNEAGRLPACLLSAPPPLPAAFPEGGSKVGPEPEGALWGSGWAGAARRRFLGRRKGVRRGEAGPGWGNTLLGLGRPRGCVGLPGGVGRGMGAAGPAACCQQTQRGVVHNIIFFKPEIKAWWVRISLVCHSVPVVAVRGS